MTGRDGQLIEPIDLLTPDGVRLEAVLHRPESAPIGRVVLAHGIMGDLGEGGLFERLAGELTGAGFCVLRFSFRGHGRSGGHPEGVTIGGEMLDLVTAYQGLEEVGGGGEAAIIAASFGAVSTSLLLETLPRPPRALVYWNPVLDLRQTFLEPLLPWGLEHFGDRITSSLAAQGSLEVSQPWLERAFRFGPALFAEMHHYDIRKAFLTSRVAALVIHGDKDSCVSFDLVKDASGHRANVTFVPIWGSEHGFHLDGYGDRAIGSTCDWLAQQFSQDAP